MNEVILAPLDVTAAFRSEDADDSVDAANRPVRRCDSLRRICPRQQEARILCLPLRPAGRTDSCPLLSDRVARSTPRISARPLGRLVKRSVVMHKPRGPPLLEKHLIHQKPSFQHDKEVSYEDQFERRADARRRLSGSCAIVAASDIGFACCRWG